jgi:Uma2 family endonuclease
MAVGGITIEEFESLPISVVKNQELIDGTLVDVSGRTFGHNLLRDELLVLLTPPVESQKLGMVICEQDFEFHGDVHGPDVALIGTGKLRLVEPDRRVQLFAPDLAIEIVSGDETFNTVLRKVLRYRRCGTKEVWVFSMATRQALVHSDERQALLDDDQIFESSLIPGFAMQLADLFDQA